MSFNSAQPLSRLPVFEVVSVILSLLTLSGLTAACGARERGVHEPADLVLRGGRIITLDDKLPEAEAFEEDVKGTLSVGKLADITVLTRDITAVPDDAIRQAKVTYTIIGDTSRTERIVAKPAHQALALPTGERRIGQSSSSVAESSLPRRDSR